ncbi:MAG: hypothetical protein ACE5GE_01650 [Phycisphaerae bacterium]
MSIHCTRCRHRNVPMARFCARCGSLLATPATPGGSCGILPLLLLMAVGCFWLAGPLGSFLGHTRTSRPHFFTSRVERHYDLTAAKADALYTLLAPNHVQVLVGREQGGVFVKGTRREVEVLDRFIDLLTRFHGWDAFSLRQTMMGLQPTWDVQRTYKLGDRQARALYQLLAFQDVPVAVAQHCSGIHIDATAEDQQTLGQLVAILKGY